MKRFLRSTLSDLTYQAMRLTNGHAAGLRILTYHRVTDAHPGDRLCVPVQRFEEQMRWLHDRGYRTISLAQAVDRLQGMRNAEGALSSMDYGRWTVDSGVRRAVVLTFDDGYEDNFRYAAPAMERYGFTGIFFVPSGFIEQRADVLTCRRPDEPAQALRHSGTQAPGHESEDRPMTYEQLRELLRRGHEVGGHSATHRRLARLQTVELFWEVRGCKETLEQFLQRPVDFFCYPSGDYNALVKRAVQSSGYRGACTVEPGANAPGIDPFALKRTEISAFDSLRDFEKKLAGAYDWMHRVVQRTGKRSP